MIALLMVAPLIAWGCWWMFSDGHARRPAASQLGAAPSAVTGLEDNSGSRRTVPGLWTALDDLQLARLLTISALVNRPQPDPIDPVVSYDEHEDFA